MKMYAEAELEAKRHELDRMHRAWKQGNVLAVFDATIYCDEEPKLPLPGWALHFWAQELVSSLKARRPGPQRPIRRRGRHTRPTVRYADILRDFTRYETVQECREHRDQIAKVRGRYVYELAEILLKDSPAAGSSKTIERVYYKVKLELQRNPYKYYLSRYSRRFFPEFYFGYGHRILSLLTK